MKRFNLTQCAVLGIALCVLILEFSTQALSQGVDPTLGRWLKENQLGPYHAEKQDWKAIQAAAEKEGKVVVYSNSTGVKFINQGFMKKYPKIKRKPFLIISEEDAVSI